VRASNAIATGMLATAIARPMSQRIITALRSHRSMSAPTGRLNTRYGNARSAPAMPAASGELVNARMRSGMTTVEAVDPRVETTCPLHRSM
jgi:hypothetical protein